MVEDPDPSDLSAALAECIIRTAVEHHAGCEWRCAVPSGTACQKADDSPGNGNGTMTGETQSDGYSSEKGPAAATFAKIVSARVRLLVLGFVTTSCLGEMGYCDKRCLTAAVSNSSDYSRPVSSGRCTSLGVFLPWLVRDLPPSPLSSPALPPHHLHDLNLGL